MSNSLYIVEAQSVMAKYLVMSSADLCFCIRRIQEKEPTKFTRDLFFHWILIPRPDCHDVNKRYRCKQTTDHVYIYSLFIQPLNVAPPTYPEIPTWNLNWISGHLAEQRKCEIVGGEGGGKLIFWNETNLGIMWDSHSGQGMPFTHRTLYHHPVGINNPIKTPGPHLLFFWFHSSSTIIRNIWCSWSIFPMQRLVE